MLTGLTYVSTYEVQKRSIHILIVIHINIYNIFIICTVSNLYYNEAYNNIQQNTLYHITSCNVCTVRNEMLSEGKINL